MTGAPVADLLMRDALRAGQAVRLRVASHSMVPTFAPGDLLSVDGGTPGIGDVAVAWIDGAWVTHRVIGSHRHKVLLAGDAPGAGSHTIDRAAVFGRVVSVRHSPRHWFRRAFALVRGVAATPRRSASGPDTGDRELQWAVAHGALLYARVDAAFRRAQVHGSNLVGGLLAGSLSHGQLEGMAARFYEAMSMDGATKDTLWDWEERWYGDRLPAPPARILLGAAGTGREAGWLAKRGYIVDAFEPARRCARACAERLGTTGSTVVATYRDMVAAVFEASSGPLGSIGKRKYDAVILGWGSLSHVLSPADREQVLRAASSLAPRGPVLASFFVGSSASPRVRQPLGWRLGESLGRFIAKRDGPAVDAGHTSFGLWYGMAYKIPPEEIEAVAADLGRRAEWDGRPGEYPHVTLLPAHPPSS